MRQIKVALADDHPIVLTGIKALIEAERDLTVCCASGDGETALSAILKSDADVAVIDLSMPRLDGIEVISRLRAARSRLRLLALTVHEDPAYLRRVLEAGANGYLLKRSAAEELIEAIFRVFGGSLYIDRAIADKPAEPLVDSSMSIAGLSEREIAVLRLLAQGYTSKEVADRLDIGIKTVDTYKGRAAEKLNLRTRPQIVRFAAAQGWLSGL